MENASKALLIAGAIFLAVLIIAIGMYIYTSSHNSISEAGSQISEHDKVGFNQQWNKYEGAQGGNIIKSLLQKVIANCNINTEEETKLVGIKFVDSSDQVTTLDINEDNIELNIKIITALRNHIESRHTYYVTLEYDSKTSLVKTIVIRYKESQPIPEDQETVKYQSL